MNIPYTRHPAGGLPSTRLPEQYDEAMFSGDGPLVSCLMVTRGNPSLVSAALACFRAQTWQNKELVVVCANITQDLRDLMKDDRRVRLVEITQELPLGDLRNLALARSAGTYVCQWDDDDLYDPRRIAVMMGVLNSAGVMSVFMSRWLIWWPARDIVALSATRLWEGSMLAHRSVIPAYPSITRGEDSYVASWITAYHPTALLDCAHMYCYRITGQNTWGESHFEQMLASATKVFEGDEKRAILKLPCFQTVQRP